MRKSTTALAVLTLAALALGACGGAEPNDSPGDSDDGQNKELTTVSYMTSFSTFGRDSYVYVADAKGFFEEEGLDVEINPGKGSGDSLKLLTAGTTDFSPIDAYSLSVAISEQDVPVTAVAAIQQHTMAAVATVKSTGITQIAQLEGHTFADSPGSANQTLLPMVAKVAGFDADKVQFVASTPPDLPRLLAAGQVDSIGQYVVGKGLIELTAEQEAVFFPYDEYLPNLYGAFLTTRTELVEKNPEVVEKFTRALIKGLRYTIENPDEAGQILADATSGQDPKVAAAEVEIMAKYVVSRDDSAPVGKIDGDRLGNMLKELADQGLLQRELTASDIYTDGFVK